MTPTESTHTPSRAAPPPFLSPSSTRVLRTGNAMPVLGLGTWLLTSHTTDWIRHAVGLGYRLIDTSPDYQTQPGIAAALQAIDLPREDFYVVSKVEPQQDTYEATRRALAELRLEFADLMLIHEPPDSGVGAAAWRGLIRARDEGLTRDIGVCSYTTDKLRELAGQTGEMPAVHQIEWSPFGHSLDMLAFCAANDLQLQAYSPLTHGKRLDDARLAGLAGKYGKSPAQLILRWNLQHGVVPLPKSTRADHQRENFDVFDFRIDEADMAAIDALNEHFSALGKLEYL
jgi:2,5-diketo-D-gluconate reductase A